MRPLILIFVPPMFSAMLVIGATVVTTYIGRSGAAVPVVAAGVEVEPQAAIAAHMADNTMLVAAVGVNPSGFADLLGIAIPSAFPADTLKDHVGRVYLKLMCPADFPGETRDDRGV